MLSIAQIRDHPDEVRRLLARRDSAAPLDSLLALDERRRAVLTQVQSLRERRNAANETIKRSGRPSETQRLEMRGLSDQIKSLDADLAALEQELNALLLALPNLPYAEVPVGEDDRGNVEVRRWGVPPSFSFAPRPHWEIGERLGILDMEAGAKLAGARFYVLRGLGARLQRALISFFLDVHVDRQGFAEVAVPYLIRSTAMLASGKLPKFAEDAYYLREDDLWLNPTAEVPVTDLHRDDILDTGQLPLRYAAYCPSWRREAGAAGRDTRGIIRNHQFHKVEMYAFCRPEDSAAEYARMIGNAEELLQLLGLPYRVLQICTGDLSYAAATAVDLDVWLPGIAEYVEISSISNCDAFQARRAGIRFRQSEAVRPAFVHTLNGSGLPIDRTVAALLENGQQADGSVRLPAVLHPYMGVDVIQ